MVPLSIGLAPFVYLISLQDGKGQLWLTGPNVHNPSHCARAVLAPAHKPAVAGLAEYSVANGAAISQRDHAAACGIRSSLQSLAAQLTLSLQSGLAGGQIEQPLSPMSANNGMVADGDLGQSNSHYSRNAGAGEAVRAVHCLGKRCEDLCLACVYSRASGGPWLWGRPDCSQTEIIIF